MTVQARFAALPGILGATRGGLMLAVVCGLSLATSTLAMAEDCQVSLDQPWQKDLVASAYVSGTCDAATIDLVVHNGVDEVVWSTSYVSSQLFGFDEAVDADSMRMALGDWLGDYADSSSSATLPEWPQGADMPEAGEFPFYVDEGVTQQLYEELRAADYPMICYIQGRESTLCLIKQPGVNALISVGAQSFPG